MATAEQRSTEPATPARRARRAKLHVNGNVIEFEPYRDDAERLARIREARATLAAGGTVQAARRRTLTDDRCPLTAEALLTERRHRPEEFLMLAMLERAMLDLRGSDRRRREEAEDWLAAEDRAHVFGFGSVCDQLGRAPGDVRAVLRGAAPRLT